MELTGLSFAEAASVFAAFGLTTVALYLLKLRRRRVEVPFVDLWSEVLSEERSSQLFSSLRRILSLLVSLMVVLLLAAALGDPRPEHGAGHTTIVVVDASLSMQATDVAPSRFEAAREAAREIALGVGEGDRMLLVSMGARPSPASTLTDDPVVLRAALDALEPGDTIADPDRALEVALDAALGADDVEIILVTDGSWSLRGATVERARASGATLHAILVGDASTQPNVAITALAARRHPLDPSRAEVMVELLGSPEGDAAVEVVLGSEGRAVDVLTLSVPAGARVRRFFEDVSGLDRVIEATVRRTDGGADLLPADDRAVARIPERRRRRIAVVSDDNAYLEAALLLDELLEVLLVADVAAVPDDVEVVIVDGIDVPDPLAGPTLFLAGTPSAEGAPAARGPVAAEATTSRPRFDRIERDHPLVRWVALRDVNVATADVLVPDADDTVVAGDDGVPLLVTGRRGGVPFVELAFDVRASDLPLRVAWPVLLLNAIELLAPDDARTASSHRAGERISLTIPGSATHAELVLPDGTSSSVPVALGRMDTAIDRAGLYTVRAGGEDELVAVSPASGTESLLGRTEPLVLGDTPLDPPDARVAQGGSAAWIWLVLGALVVLGVEIVTYHRRVTV